MTPTNHGAHFSDAEMHNEDVAHEHSDVDIRTVLAFAAGLAVVVIISALLMWIAFRAFESQASARDPQLSPVAPPVGQQPAGAPRLLTDEPGNLRKVRSEENKSLEGYGWVDEKGGVAHVPIEEAKKLLIQHGLPVRATGDVPDPSTGTHAPAYGESSGGRAIFVPKPPAAGAPPAPPQGLATEVKK